MAKSGKKYSCNKNNSWLMFLPFPTFFSFLLLYIITIANLLATQKAQNTSKKMAPRAVVGKFRILPVMSQINRMWKKQKNNKLCQPGSATLMRKKFSKNDRKKVALTIIITKTFFLQKVLAKTKDCIKG